MGINIDFTSMLHRRLSEVRPLVQLLLGPRQVGKTTAARALHDQFQGSKLFISADGPTPPNAEWLRTHWWRIRSEPEPALFIVDEVQKIPGWSEVVKQEFDIDRDKRDLRVLLLGSSSLSLQRGLTESLAGRFELIHAHHWNPGEMQSVFNWNLSTYLMFGGYPGAARYIDDIERWQQYIRESIIEPVIGGDILTARSVSKPALFRQAFEVLLHYPAQQVSYQKVIGQLQERGSSETIKHYIHLFESAFLMKAILSYSTRPLTSRTSSPKIVPLAPALLHAFVNPKRIEVDTEWRGHVFEAVVGAALARKERNLFTWRHRGDEIDYVVSRPGELIAIEVKSGRRKSASGISRFLQLFPKARTVIITPESAAPLLRGESIDSLLT